MLLGITGGIATGKSAVTALLAELGAVVFSADEAARAATAPDSPLLLEIGKRFGANHILADGSLNRPALAHHIFAHPEDRRALEELTHPAILKILRKQIDSTMLCKPQTPLIAVEVPLLYEAGMQSWFDRVLVVAASESVEIERLCSRDAIEPAEARRRLSAQWPLVRKIEQADYVLYNDKDFETLKQKVNHLWQQLTGLPPARCPLQ